jgi:glycosyltransferase involved in cell wall biosynthesis
VTESTLQRRYPCRGVQVDASNVELGGHSSGVYTTHFSSVELVDGDYTYASRHLPFGQPCRLITVGSLAQMYKGVDTLIDAVTICVSRGVRLNLTVVGDGRFRPALEHRAAIAGVREQVSFVGALPAGSRIQQELDKADVFVLASRTEGLPRAMIEAMARGLPCIGTSVGGIPELLPHADRVPANDPRSLAEKIVEVISSPARIVEMSTRSLAVARRYHASELRQRRVQFYKMLRHSVEADRYRRI